jgi:hypothetical protein
MGKYVSNGYNWWNWSCLQINKANRCHSNSLQYQMTILWVVTPYMFVGECQCFGGTYCLRHQGDGVTSTWNSVALKAKGARSSEGAVRTMHPHGVKTQTTVQHPPRVWKNPDPPRLRQFQVTHFQTWNSFKSKEIKKNFWKAHWVPLRNEIAMRWWQKNTPGR